MQVWGFGGSGVQGLGFRVQGFRGFRGFWFSGFSGFIGFRGFRGFRASVRLQGVEGSLPGAFSNAVSLASFASTFN